MCCCPSWWTVDVGTALWVQHIAATVALVIAFGFWRRRKPAPRSWLQACAVVCASLVVFASCTSSCTSASEETTVCGWKIAIDAAVILVACLAVEVARTRRREPAVPPCRRIER
jgi:hypothetical protein